MTELNGLPTRIAMLFSFIMLGISGCAPSAPPTELTRHASPLPTTRPVSDISHGQVVVERLGLRPGDLINTRK
ncbi:MAG: hypothetical protein ACR2NP_19685, partial [Pirellulaceae bacterium]